MQLDTKSILIIGGVALGGFLAYKYFTKPAVKPTSISKSTTGTGNSVAAATGNGSGGTADFWGTLGAAGKGLNGAVSSVESTYNNVYDLFGGNSSSSGTGQGNNGTAG